MTEYTNCTQKGRRKVSQTETKLCILENAAVFLQQGTLEEIKLKLTLGAFKFTTAITKVGLILKGKSLTFHVLTCSFKMQNSNR